MACAAPTRCQSTMPAQVRANLPGRHNCHRTRARVPGGRAGSRPATPPARRRSRAAAAASGEHQRDARPSGGARVTRVVTTPRDPAHLWGRVALWNVIADRSPTLPPASWIRSPGCPGHTAGAAAARQPTATRAMTPCPPKRRAVDERPRRDCAVSGQLPWHMPSPKVNLANVLKRFSPICAIQSYPSRQGLEPSITLDEQGHPASGELLWSC